MRSGHAYGWDSLEEVHIHVHYHCIHVHYHCIYMYTTYQEEFMSRVAILYSPDAGHSGCEESAEWLDLARGGTIASVHNIPPCNTDE